MVASRKEIAVDTVCLDTRVRKDGARGCKMHKGVEQTSKAGKSVGWEEKLGKSV